MPTDRVVVQNRTARWSRSLSNRKTPRIRLAESHEAPYGIREKSSRPRVAYSPAMESEHSQSTKKATGLGRGRGIRRGGSRDPGGSPLHSQPTSHTVQAPQSKETSSNSPPFNCEASSPPAGIDQYADTPGNAGPPRRGIFSGSTVSAETSDPVVYPPKDQYGPTGNAPDARLHAGEGFQKAQANAPAHVSRGRSEKPVGKTESRLRFPSLPSDLTSEELAKIVAENGRLADDDVRVEFLRHGDDAASAVVVLNDGNGIKSSRLLL